MMVHNGMLQIKAMKQLTATGRPDNLPNPQFRYHSQVI